MDVGLCAGDGSRSGGIALLHEAGARGRRRDGLRARETAPVDRLFPAFRLNSLQRSLPRGGSDGGNAALGCAGAICALEHDAAGTRRQPSGYRANRCDTPLVQHVCAQVLVLDLLCFRSGNAS